MLFKNFIPIVGCLLGATGALADKQSTTEHSNIPRAIVRKNADEPRDPQPDFIAVRLYSEPDSKGSQCTIDRRYLEQGKCLNIPKDHKVKSISLSGFKCCLLYRSPCPHPSPSVWHSQNPGWFHQKIFGSGVKDLTPYGFTDNPLSIVCPIDEICDAFLLDRNWSDRELVNIAPWWVDYRTIPGRKYI